MSLKSFRLELSLIFLIKYFSRASESPIKAKLNNDQMEYSDGIDPYYQSTRYWSTMKNSNNQLDSPNQEDLMVGSMNNIDLVNYSSVDFGSAQQKMMSLSLGPQQLSQSQGPQGIPVPPPLPPPMAFQQPQYPMHYNNFNTMNNHMSSSFVLPPPINDTKYITVQLHPNGGPLGITLAGNEDSQKPIVISGMEEGGIAFNTGQIQIGDTLLAINNEPVSGMPLMEAKKLLQANNESIELKLSRPGNSPPNQMNTSVISMSDKVPQPQALYAQVQRRPRSPQLNVAPPIDVISNGGSSSSRSGSGNDNQYKTMHVTLYKDQVYDDYGFSVSDGLYEKGVYINRIRTGGPADNVCILKPYDRIIQVSDMCCFS